MLVACSLNRLPPASPLHQTCYSGGMGRVLRAGSGEGHSKTEDCLVTLEVLQLIALPRGGSPGAGGHSGQEPTLQPGPHLQDAHTEGPKAVVSQPELHADSGVNLNQTLPHGSPGKQMLLQWKPADLFMETSQAGRYRGKGWKTSHGQGICADLGPRRPLRSPSCAGGRSAP